MNMNISCRIANANTQCGRITNPPERILNAVGLQIRPSGNVIPIRQGSGKTEWYVKLNNESKNETIIQTFP